MIVLDTNLISELIRKEPESSVISWVNRQHPKELYITSITVAEIMYGIGSLPQGKKRARLFDLSTTLIDNLFKGRVLSFDRLAALEYAHIAVIRKHQGTPISLADGEIAAICRSMDAPLVTRNVKDFSGIDLELINPWKREE
jgi:predicted nucleic acid-binding protein